MGGARGVYPRRIFRTGLAVLAAALAVLPVSGQAGNDPLTLVVSLDSQRLTAYRGDELVFTSPVSSGRKGYRTPTGVFSILDKRRWHRSNIYSQAPMPFMQRLTWSGIALHAGHLPGYPASHGCVRLPNAKAQELFAMTRMGAHVVVMPGWGAPVRFSHRALFQPSPPEAMARGDEAAREADSRPVPRIRLAEAPGATTTDIRGSLAWYVDPLSEEEMAAAAIKAYTERPREPLRIYITRRTGRERITDMQTMLEQLGHDTGGIDGLMGPRTGAAIRSFQGTVDVAPTGAYSDELMGLLYSAVGVDDPAEAHLYVRQGFRPLFDAPVRLRDRERPLGTNLFTVMHFEDGDTRAEWLALGPVDGTPRGAASALNRIEIPRAVRHRINRLLTPGSSLLISDQGLGPETGARGTDFIVLTQ